MEFDPVLPVSWIATVAAVALVAALAGAVRANGRLPAGRALLLTALRLLGVAGIAALLLQPSQRHILHPPARERSIVVAVDSSASMAVTDADGAARLDAAREAIRESVLAAAGDTSVHLHAFDRSTRPIGLGDLDSLAASGPDTRFHSSIERIVAAGHQPPPAALLVFSDGHDFEGESPGRTARGALSRDMPIFTVPFGSRRHAADLSLRIASYHPYTFIGQRTRLAGALRVSGYPNQQVVVDLLRQGETIESRTVSTGAARYLDVEFTVSEEQPGQYEYTLRARPMRGETETDNNRATTFLNVVEDKLRVLEIEGSPWWDSTFLRRSLTRNDKFEIDSLVAFAESRIRALRSDAELADQALAPPTGVDDFSPYQIVLLGRDADKVLGHEGIEALAEWVRDDDGIVIFTRGRAWQAEVARELEPIDWGDRPQENVSLELSETEGFPPLRILQEASRHDDLLAFDALPDLGEPRSLSSVLGRTAGDRPAIVYRRFGAGQVLSLGIANAWRWVFNERTEFDNNSFDRFWDQTALWLLANRGLAPLSGFSFSANSANIPLGETIRFTLGAGGVELPSPPPSVTVSHEARPLAKLPLGGEAADRLTADFVPEETGLHRAVVTLPDGGQREIRFHVFNENLEAIETAADLPYLEALAAASGGRMLEVDEIPQVLSGLLRESSPQEPLERLHPIWPTRTVFLSLAMLLALDWYLRRKWGLA